MSRSVRSRGLWGLMAAIVLLAVLPGAAAAATRPTEFNLYLGSSCVGGNSSDGAIVDFTWRRASGKLVYQVSTRAGRNGGYWEICGGDGFTTPITKVGDQLEAKVGSAVRRLTIPKVTLRFDRAANVFKGSAPASTNIWLIFPIERELQAKSDGTWSHREPNFDIKGGQYAYLRWHSAKNDRITVDSIAPFIRVTLGESQFSGIYYAKLALQSRMLDGSTSAVLATGRTTAGRHGQFSGHYRDPNGHPFTVAAGMRVKAAKLGSDASWIVPNINGSANADTDVVKGRCFDAGTSDRWYDARVLQPDGETRAWSAGNTGTKGAFEVDFDEGLFYNRGNVMSGDTVVIGCRQKSGDWAQRRFVVP